ncbi:hypothetical protein [[Limnothrix rosea] IAM M-220]|uniref:hypothetical protein n=1 Tax=[Limnothrix rosea] IAM M-220 TaxID=454133 RepID=UPI0009675975|nr:hypothetical protein [[Limnothrix rosea] IAM M-220]OKH10892.1 hypothetical protein NIES208_18075 [[Limnothrix rosea] IAM M-220]
MNPAANNDFEQISSNQGDEGVIDNQEKQATGIASSKRIEDQASDEEIREIESQKDILDKQKTLYISNKTIFTAGAIGGVGSVCIKLIGEESGRNESLESVEEETSRTDLLRSVDFSELSYGLGAEFVIYLIMSIFLGALSGFILVSMGGISTRLDNQQRCLASAMLFGLFFPSSIQLMKQNFDSQIKIESQQKEVQELKVKEETLSQKNSALREESKEAIVTLTRTEDVQENPELKQKVLEGYIDIFRNVDEASEQKNLLINISDVGEGNIVENTSITRNAVNFLELVAMDEKYEISVKEVAEKKAAEIRVKCELEGIDCG